MHLVEHRVVFIIKTNADVGDGERVQNYYKSVDVTKSVIKKGQRNMVILWILITRRDQVHHYCT